MTYTYTEDIILRMITARKNTAYANEAEATRAAEEEEDKEVKVILLEVAARHHSAGKALGELYVDVKAYLDTKEDTA